MGPQSSLLLENKSSVLLDSGSTLSVGDSAEVHVGAGCIFEASRYANLRLGRHARIVVEDGGTLIGAGRRYSSGTYFVRYRSKNGVPILKFVKAE